MNAKISINFEEVCFWDAVEDHICQLLVDMNMVHLHILNFFKIVWATLSDEFAFIILKIALKIKRSKV